MSNSGKRSWVMYRHKQGVALYDPSYGYMAGNHPHELNRTEVRYSVLCEAGEPVLFSGTELVPHSAEADDPNRKYVHIASPRNVRFAPDDMDQDPRQWSRTAMPADKFMELYEKIPE